jgi:hypothetical protein
MGIHILDEQLIERIERIARREQREEVDVIAQAVELYEEKAVTAKSYSFLLSIADLGSSREGDISTRDEEILSREVDPLRGWAAGDGA